VAGQDMKLLLTKSTFVKRRYTSPIFHPKVRITTINTP